MSAPVADFSFTPVEGRTPPGVNVQFTDLSANAPTSWLWAFGDGTTSYDQNPTHLYNQVGRYAVSLTVTNADGSDTKTIPAYQPGGPSGPWITSGR